MVLNTYPFENFHQIQVGGQDSGRGGTFFLDLVKPRVIDWSPRHNKEGLEAVLALSLSLSLSLCGNHLGRLSIYFENLYPSVIITLVPISCQLAQVFFWVLTVDYQ